jgi:hypothetical protein
MEGDWVIPAEHEKVLDFSEGVAAVKKGGKWGYINKNGTIAVDFLFDDATSFKNGTALVMRDSKAGMIDRKGDFVIEPIYDEKYTWPDERGIDAPIGLAKDGHVGFVNALGEIVIDFKFKSTEDVAAYNYNVFSNGRAVVFLDEPEDEKAVIDETGNVLFRIGKDVRIPVPIYLDDYIVGRRGKDMEEVLIFDRDGRIYDVSRYFKKTFFVLSSNNVFLAAPIDDRGTIDNVNTNDWGYFTITRKEGK